MVYQNVPHELRRNGKKMRPVVQGNGILLGHAKVGFVDERGTLKRVVGALAAKVSPG
jgi:hypothetical protein